MNANIEDLLKELSEKLSVLISLSLEDRQLSVKDKVELLSKFELNNKEIAKILKISETHVAKEKSLSKKGK